MRCRQCDYQLWNLPPGPCPECGEPFLPSDFTLRRGAVQFLCPHCKQAYYGSDPKGHLDPRAFDCVSCGKHIGMDWMTLRPAEGVDPDSVVLDRQPWIDRKQIGFWRGWWRTTFMGMFNPVKLARCTPPDAGLGAAWKFAAFNHLLVFGIGGGLYTLFMLLMMLLSFAGGGGGGGGMNTAIMLGTLAIMVAFFGVFYGVALLFVAIWIGITHLFLKITGGAPRPMHATALSILYTSGAYVTNLIPCVNNISWLWWPIVAGITLKDLQGVAAWRAVTATLITPVLTVVAFVAAYAAFVAWAMSLAGAGMNTSFSAIQTQVALTRVHAALMADGLGVDDPTVHALTLVADGRITASEVIHPSSLTSIFDVPVADGDLSDFQAMPPAEQLAIAQAAADALPDDVTAHRLGDLVLTYHGMDFRSDQRLWVAIISPDPDANPGAEGIDGNIWVLDASGATEPIPVEDFDQALAEQNERRAKSKLAPLPHPYDIRHAEPAVAPPQPNPEPDPDP